MIEYFILGMAFQAMGTSALATMGLIKMSPGQSAIAALLLAGLACVVHAI